MSEVASFQQSKAFRNDCGDKQCLVVTGAKGMCWVRVPQGNPQPLAQAELHSFSTLEGFRLSKKARHILGHESPLLC